MHQSNFSRRRFLKTALGGAAAIPTLNLLSSQVAFASTGQAEHAIVTVFLRGAMDGLNTLVPYQEAQYYHLRPTIAIPKEGYIPLNNQFALHKAMTPLLPVYQQGELAFINAVGLGPLSSTRSHFDAQRRMEAATDNPFQDDGWLGRYLAETQADDAVFRSIGVKRLQKSLKGYSAALSVGKLKGFGLKTSRAMRKTEAQSTLSALYQSVENDLLVPQANNAFNAMDLSTPARLPASARSL